MRWWLALLGAVAFFGPAAAPAAAQERERLDIRLFARVPDPGQPEPIAVATDGTVYVGTNQLGRGDAAAPSKVFAYSPDGALLREYVIEGQPLAEEHGIQGLAFDTDGRLYALDRSATPRVIVLDPATGRQHDYAAFRDVPPCSAGSTGDCSATFTDAPAAPDYAAFGPDGSLYVTDIEQALIWRVPRGGGAAEVWLTDPRLESIFGPNGIHFMPDGRTLLFAVTGSPPWAGGPPVSGRLYSLPVQSDGAPGELAEFWTSRPGDGPDGFAIAASGNVYVALAGASQIVLLSPQGAELGRAPATPVHNLQLEVPVDGPGSAAFHGDRVLVTNHSPILGNRGSWAVLDVFAGEPGLPLFRPQLDAPRAPASRPRIGVTVRPRTAVAGRRARFRFKVTVTEGAETRPVEGAVIRFAGRRTRTGETGRASVVKRFRRTGRYVATVRKRGLRSGTAVVRVRSR
jgi:sugar lactone lactonase YvrE